MSPHDILVLIKIDMTDCHKKLLTIVKKPNITGIKY